MSRRSFVVAGAAFAIAGCGGAGPAQAQANFPFRLSDGQWRQRLSRPAYDVLRGHGTERPGSSPLDREHRRGTFHCAGCNHPLFASSTKFDSGTGWPSFWRPLPRAVGTSEDRSLLSSRTEVHCANCGGHLGHVFNDGPRPTGLRYCMNGIAMTFRPA
ncbi:MAG TPA: peptide-methionine (R)-S-oxide reductase MsrB [Allosphingosinicella sp.]